jgi:hypothetical protein
MASTKSTVLGIRLDRDRRAWVESEAARLGVSVRALFEGMIDGARTGEEEDADRAIAGLGPAPGAAAGGRPVNSPAGTVGPEEPSTAGPAGGVNTERSLWAGSSPWPDLGPVTALPGGLIRIALSITTGLIQTGGRCARSTLEHCPVARQWSSRSA